MDKLNLTGIVPILLTPFDVDDNIDLNSLCNQIDYCIDAGVGVETANSAIDGRVKALQVKAN